MRIEEKERGREREKEVREKLLLFLKFLLDLCFFSLFPMFFVGSQGLKPGQEPAKGIWFLEKG